MKSGDSTVRQSLCRRSGSCRDQYDPDTIIDQLKIFESHLEAILKDMREHRDARKEITDNILVPLEKY